MMTEVIIRIQSLNGIITNSSTEIITTLAEDAVDTIREMVNELLKVGGSRYCFDDLFIITTYWDKEDEWEDAGFNSKEDYIERLEECGGDLDYRASGKNYIVKAKDPKNEEAAKLLTELQNITDYIQVYN
jgi:hypothetical protein